MMTGLARFERFNDLLALLMALMFILMLLMRGAGAPVSFSIGNAMAACGNATCSTAELSA